MRKRSKKNKLALKVTAMVLSVALAGTAVYGVGRIAFSDKVSDTSKVEAKEKTDSEKLNDAVNTAAGITEGSEASDKTETVYIITDGDSNTKDVIVSDHLKNTDKVSTIEDATDLTNLENTKGDEEFTVGTGDTITWDAQGNDIYYQGDTNKSLPIAVKTTYELDGKPISADEIAGQSGHVKIRLDYENYKKVTEKVNGKNYEVYVPFVCVSGMMLDSEKFTDVEVTNGTVVSEGGNQVALGYAFPGLKESLGIGTEVLKDNADDIDIPDYVEIEADVEDFELSLAMTVATPNALNDLDIDTIDTKDTDKDIDDMEDAADQLLDGTAELSDGADTLASSMKTAEDGADQIATGVDKVVTGLNVTLPNSLQSAIDQYTGAAKMLKSSQKTMTKATTTMVEDAATAAATASGKIAGTAAGTAAATAAATETVNQIVKNAAGSDDQPSLTGDESSIITKAATESVYANKYASGAAQAAGGASQTATGASKKIQAALYYLNKEDRTDADIATAIALLSDDSDESSPSAATLAAKSAEYADKASDATSQAADYANQAYTDLAGDGTDENPGFKELFTDAMHVDQSQENMAAIGAAATSAATTAVTDALTDEDNQKTINSTVNSAIKTDKENVTDAATQFGQAAGAKGAVTALTSTKKTIAKKFDSKSLNTLNKGAAKLADGTVKLTDGSKQLAKGAKKLNSGMSDFKDQAIDKLVDLYKNDLKGLKNRLEAVQKAGEDYTIFSKLADGADGKVTFIFKTEAVKLDDDK